MPLELVASFDYTKLNQSLDKLSKASADAVRASPLRAARTFVRRIVEITPPASPGRTGLAARRQGEKRIDADLSAIFFPVVLRGKRAELYPDVEGIYHQIMDGRKGRRPSRQGQLYHVDARKLAALRALLYSRVGFLAGGWNAAAEKIGVDLPDWIKRHGTEHGSCEVVTEKDGIVVSITNAVAYSGDVDGYARRVQYALDYTAATLTRETEHLLSKAKRDAGFSS